MAKSAGHRAECHVRPAWAKQRLGFQWGPEALRAHIDRTARESNTGSSNEHVDVGAALAQESCGFECGLAGAEDSDPSAGKPREIGVVGAMGHHPGARGEALG